MEVYAGLRKEALSQPKVCANLPEIHNDLLGFLGVNGQVVVWPLRSQVLDLVPVGRHIVPSDLPPWCRLKN